MSITQTENLQKILVRDADFNPKQLVFLGMVGNRIEVARQAGGSSIALPVDLVFRFDARLLERIQAAEGDERKSLWREAEPFVPPLS